MKTNVTAAALVDDGHAKTIAKPVLSGLYPVTRAELDHDFAQFDKNGDGTLTLSEVRDSIPGVDPLMVSIPGPLAALLLLTQRTADLNQRPAVHRNHEP